MKKHLAFLAALLALAAAHAQDVPVTTTTAFNLRISIQPNGALDAMPAWSSTGPGVLTVDVGNLGALLTTTTPGTNTVTISATSQGNALVSRVIVTINAPPVPPATSLAVSVGQVPK